MMKSALAAALVMGAASSAAYAKKITYTFATSTGSPYCDGIQGTTASGVFTGIHLDVQCTEGDYAGGFEGAFVFNSSTDDWAISTNEYSLGGGYIVVFTLDIKAKTWTVWLESTSGGLTFEEVNAGELLKGKKTARVGKVFHTPAALGHAVQ